MSPSTSKSAAKQFAKLAHFPDGHVDDEVDIVGRARLPVSVPRTRADPPRTTPPMSGSSP
jgi:hypothetical protein